MNEPTNSAESAAAPSKDGRMLGFLSIATSPGTLLVSPTFFALAGFFLALLGLTIAAPAQRVWSLIGLALVAICGAVALAFNTPVV